MSVTPRCCQGCGLAENTPRITWHNRRNTSGGWDHVKKVGARCVLQPLDLGGLGERQFCQRCWHLTVLENARLQHPLLGNKKKRDKGEQPDLRQIRMF